MSTLIAANESRPQFLINLFRELQLISTTDPLRDSLMGAFHELYNRYYNPNHVTGEQRPPHSSNGGGGGEVAPAPLNPLDKNHGFVSATGRTQTVSKWGNIVQLQS